MARVRSNIRESRQPCVTELMLDGQVPAIDHGHLEWTEIVRHIKGLCRYRLRKHGVVRSWHRRWEHRRVLRQVQQRIAEGAWRWRQQKLKCEWRLRYHVVIENSYSR